MSARVGKLEISFKKTLFQSKLSLLTGDYVFVLKDTRLIPPCVE
jgi:hypothetical protein